MDALQGVELSADQIEEVYEHLGGMGVTITPDNGEIEALETAEAEPHRRILRWISQSPKE